MEEFQCLPCFSRKMVLYLSTKFGILKPSTIISNLIRSVLGFWQSWKQIDRKLKSREQVLEEFQRLPGFPRNVVLYSSTNFRILKPSTIISNLIRFDLGFWQASKQIYRKFKYREKVLGEFQHLLRFPRKMVLYSSTNFCILSPGAIISNCRIFDWGFWQASKPFYRKLKYRENDFETFQRLPCFPRKMVLYSSIKFGILKSLAIISNHIRLDLGFSQASKKIYRKLKYKENVFEEFQRLRCFPREMVLYSSTKFSIFKPLTIIWNHIRYQMWFRLLPGFKRNW